jgi:stage V sporulation protein B
LDSTAAPPRKLPNLFNETFVTLIIRVFVLALALAASAVTARTLGPVANGSYNLILLLITTTALFVASGIQLSNVYYGARNPDELPALLGNSVVAAFALGLLGSAVFVLLTFLPFFVAYMAENNVDPGMMRAVIFIVPLLELNAYTPEILRGAGRVRSYILTSLWRQLAVFVFLLLFLLIVGADVTSVVYAFLASQIFLAGLNLHLALRVTGGRWQIQWHLLRRNLVFGLRFHVSAVAQFLNYRLDLFLVGFFLTPAEVGYYALATLLAERLWEIPSAIQQILLYRVAAENENASNITLRSNRIVGALMALLCLVVALLSYPLILLAYGDDYLPVVSAFILLIPGVWALSMGKILATHLAGIGRPGLASAGVVVSLVATLVFDFLLIPRLGINGAAIASSVSYSVFTVVLIFFFMRQTHARLGEVILITRQDIRMLRKSFTTLFGRLLPTRS